MEIDQNVECDQTVFCSPKCRHSFSQKLSLLKVLLFQNYRLISVGNVSYHTIPLTVELRCGQRPFST